MNDNNTIDNSQQIQASGATEQNGAAKDISSTPPAPALIAGDGTLDLLGPTIRRLAIGLLDTPMRLVLVSPPGEDTSALPSPPIDIFRAPVPFWGRYMASRIYQLNESLKRCGVNLLHSMDIASHQLTRRISMETNLPYVLSIHRSDKIGDVMPLGELCYAILTDSESLRQSVLAEGIADEHSVHLLHPGLHPNRSVSCFAKGQNSHALVATGEMDSHRPFETVLKAFAALRNSGYDCMFFIIGSGQAERRLRKLACKLKLTDVLTFNPRMKPETMSHIFSDADIVIYPGSGQTQETTVMEAMAAGAAMVVGGEGVGDFLTESENATFYDSARPQDLVAKIKMLLDEPELAIRLATNAQEYLRANHSPAAMVKILTDIYRKRHTTQTPNKP